MSARRKRKQAPRERTSAQIVPHPSAGRGPDIEALQARAARYQRKLARRGRILDSGHPRARRRVQLAATAALISIDGQAVRPRRWQLGRRLRRWLWRVADRRGL